MGDGKPFCAETVHYFENLRAAGVPAEPDIYRSDMHAFNMTAPGIPLSRQAAETFNRRFAQTRQQFFVPAGRKETYDPGDL